jgi:hypothetical protein
MSVRQAWVFTCTRCGHESGGYPDEAAAERAEETHGLFEHSGPPRKEAGDADPR